MRPNQVGDEFALAEDEDKTHLPPLPEGLNWAGPIARRAGLDVYTVVKRGGGIQVRHENGPPLGAPWSDPRTGIPYRDTILTTNKNARKNTPVFSGCLRYFPKALAAVAALSQIGNEQHNPGTPLHWDRSKSGDEWDALTRHLLEVGAYDTDGVRHSAKVAWRALAGLQKELEDSERTDARPSDPTADAGRGSSCDEGELGPGC